jgi:cellulose synthase/poly-beta-1,6-N-acetylglucosamine synthase-like glycosyltransferase
MSLYGIHRYVILYLYWKNRRRAPQPDRQFSELPRVTVQLPIFNEFFVVERLLESVGQLDYPQDKLQIQVLDDSTDETRPMVQVEVEKLRAKGFDVELRHRVDRTGFKAGALDEGMATCKGEYILILDADFVPPADLLQKTIHFFTNENTGMVQTRWGHLNRDYSLLTRVQALYIDAHFVLEQTARSRSGRFFNFNGTTGVWRKSCIVDAGGWQHDTLTEDLDLSYRAQLEGWSFIYLNDVVTPAELPVEMNGFKSQQHRWAKGSVQTCLKLMPALWRSKLPLFIKIEGTAHFTSYFISLLLVFYCLLIWPTLTPQHHTWAHLLFLDMPMFMITSIPFILYYLVAQRQLNPTRWVRELVLVPFMISIGVGVSLNNTRAVLEALFRHESHFIRTPKYGINAKGQPWRRGRYSPLKSLLIAVEIIFAGYFIGLTCHAWIEKNYSSVPFLLLFTMGFLYVAFKSVAQWLPKLGERPAPAPLPA